MKFRKTRISILTLVMFAVAGAMFAFGALNFGLSPYITSDDLQSEFQLDHIGVNLLENHKAIGTKDEAGGKLMDYLKEADADGDGVVDIAPGKKYREEITALNSSGVNQYVRIIVRKYWMTANGEKDTSMDPGLIKLKFGKSDYNSKWQINAKEHTTETDTYYYKSVVPAGEETDLLVDTLQIDSSVAEKYVSDSHQNEEGQTVITYSYENDGKIACVEAEAQALQPHNINDAIKSVWGVQNVTVSGNTLSVGQ